MKHLFPVLHHENDDITFRNAEIALQCGCTGVMLIQMNGDNRPLSGLAAEIRRRLGPALLIGINRLGEDPADAVSQNLAVAEATWTDNCHITSRGTEPQGAALARLAKANPGHLVFGGIAFKYQQAEDNPPLAAHNALERGIIPTTSGAGTGKAPEVEKLESIHRAIGDNLALASGVTPDNVGQFLPYTRYFLVATGISHDFLRLDPDKVRRLQETISRFA